MRKMKIPDSLGGIVQLVRRLRNHQRRTMKTLVGLGGVIRLVRRLRDHQRHTLRTLVGLGGISLVCALLLTGLQALTDEAIDRNRATHAWRTAFELTGETFDTSNLKWRDGRVRLPDGGWLQRAATPGYAGDIHLLAAFDEAGRLLGVRVTGHRETPGLGDFIDLDKNPWMLRFSESSPLAVDAVTGATITSEAVKREVQRMVEATLTKKSQRREPPG